MCAFDIGRCRHVYVVGDRNKALNAEIGEVGERERKEWKIKVKMKRELGEKELDTSGEGEWRERELKRESEM
jgi:hypothetical protein